MPLKIKQSTRKQKAVDMCELYDRSKTGEIPLEQFKRICVACNVQVAVDDEVVNYK